MHNTFLFYLHCHAGLQPDRRSGTVLQEKHPNPYTGDIALQQPFFISPLKGCLFRKRLSFGAVRQSEDSPQITPGMTDESNRLPGKSAAEKVGGQAVGTQTLFV